MESNFRELKLKEKLKLSDNKLKMLLGLSDLINKKSSKESLLQYFTEFLNKNLQIEHLLLFSKQENKWQLSISMGSDYNNSNIEVIEKLGVHNSFYPLVIEHSNTLPNLDLMVPIFGSTKQKIGLLFIGDNHKNNEELSPTIKHLPFLQTLANLVIVAIENLQAEELKIQNAKREKELELAAEIQKNLIPDKVFRNKTIEASVLYQSFGLVGGDYCDIIELSDNKIAFVIADVSGKGIAASLCMAGFRAQLRASLIGDNTDSLIKLAEKLNKTIISETKFSMFISCFIAVYNPEYNTINVLNLGHNAAILAKNGTIKTLKASTVALGMLPNLPNIKTNIVTVEPNDILVLYTDGITDIPSKNNENILFGEENLSKVILENVHEFKYLNGAVYKAISEFQPNKNLLTDDISLLSILFK